MTTQEILQGVHDWTNGKIVYDISVAHPDGQGNPTPYADLAAALGTDGANIPADIRRGGMSIKFIQGTVQSSDNKYVQYRLMTDEFTTDITQWAISEEGVLVENPEYIYVKTDNEDKILWAIKTDGSIYYGAGVPPQIVDYINEKLAELSLDEYEDIVAFLDDFLESDQTLREYLDDTYGKYIKNPEWIDVKTDSEGKILEGIKTDGTKVIGGDATILGKVDTQGATYTLQENPEWIKVLTDAQDRIIAGVRKDGSVYINNIEGVTVVLEDIREALRALEGGNTPIKVLILGDSYSENGGRWVRPMIANLPKNSSWISLAVGSATVKDRRQDREMYPYTSRPVSSDTTGNHNTLACQIQKLKRLMEGTDLDAGETQLYTSSDQYPNVIIIEGGMNDEPDSDAKVQTYNQQLETIVNNVYRRRTPTTSVEIDSVSIKTPLDTIDRTCFAGAYRYLIDELLNLFPNAQIYITTCSPISYRVGEISSRREAIAEQQRLCADIFTCNVIDWHRDGQINSIANYAHGSGTQEDPYIWGYQSGEYVDTNDQLHPNDRGGKKYGKIAAQRIKQTFIDIENL